MANDALLRDDEPSRLLARALDFIRSSAVLVDDLHDGWLPSTNLLLGFAAELLAKKQLLQRGLTADQLRSSRYGHDIERMWRYDTNLYDEAETIVEQLRAIDEVAEDFDFGQHFEVLAAGHSKVGNYSVRYHGGVKTFSSPSSLCLVFGEIARRERMR